MVSAVDSDQTTITSAARDISGYGSNTQQPARVRWGRWSYLVLSWLFAACVIVQVFFAGLAIFVDSARWLWHTSFVHAFEGLPLLMLIVAFIARLPVAIRWLTTALIGLIFFQYFTANFGGLAGAFHPVNALLLTWISINVAGRTWRVMRG
jgi:hypothetical protein